jgi:hypothetical protein
LDYRTKGLITVCIVLALSLFAGAVAATPSLRLDFYKNNGYGLGDDMQGQWTINTAVSSDVVRVEFYIDNELQNNMTTAPFSWSFNTADYSEAKHTFSVVAYDSTGVTVKSEKQANFVGFPVSFIAAIIGIIVAVTVVALVVSGYKIRKSNVKKNQACASKKEGSYPLTTPIGTKRATLVAIPTLSLTSTTMSTFL